MIKQLLQIPDESGFWTHLYVELTLQNTSDTCNWSTHTHTHTHTHTPFIMALIYTDAGASTPRLRLRSIYPAPTYFPPHSLAHLHIEEELGAAL